MLIFNTRGRCVADAPVKFQSDTTVLTLNPTPLRHMRDEVLWRLVNTGCDSLKQQPCNKLFTSHLELFIITYLNTPLWSHFMLIYLTQCVLVTPYSDKDLDQHWLTLAWQHHAIAWININSSSVRSGGYYLIAISQEMVKISITDINLKITNSRLQTHTQWPMS